VYFRPRRVIYIANFTKTIVLIDSHLTIRSSDKGRQRDDDDSGRDNHDSDNDDMGIRSSSIIITRRPSGGF